MEKKRTDRFGEFQSQDKKDDTVFVELKGLIEEELGELDKWDDYENAFQPITTGLGLDSPRKKETSLPVGGGGAPIQTKAASDVSQFPGIQEAKHVGKDEQVARIKQKVAHLSARVERTLPQQDEVSREERQASEAIPVLPPPVPSPSLYRRVLAGLIDQVFVFTLWLVAMVITLKMLTGSFVGGNIAGPVLMEEARFIQFAVMEFGAIWLTYLIFCIGVLDMTFGMWVWGIRVGYMTKSKRSCAIRRVLRTTLSFIFYAPVLPIVFLIFVGKRGRNLLDTLSGTIVYQSVVIE